MRKEKILIGTLLMMICIGVGLACDPTPPPTPDPVPTCSTTVVTDTNNNTNNNANNINNTNMNNNVNNQTQSQGQDQTQGQTQNTTIILDNEDQTTNNNQNNQTNTLDVVFQPIINVYNNIFNTANPVFTNNPVITVKSSNGQLVDVALAQETVQYAYNEQGQYQIMPKNIPFPAVLCTGAVTPYGTIIGVQEHNTNATDVGMEDTGFPIGALLAGGGLIGLSFIAAAKSGILARLGL